MDGARERLGWKLSVELDPEVTSDWEHKKGRNKKNKKNRGCAEQPGEQSQQKRGRGGGQKKKA